MVSIIFHLDMNSYFATVEQQDNPAYRGKPLGVCEHLGGIIIAASVEAKKWGIKTGTPVWEAKKIFPKIILTKTHPDRYRFYIKQVIKVVSDYTDGVEQASIDEMYLDMTKACNIKARNSKLEIRNLPWVNPFEEAISIAREIKRRMKIEVGEWLTCSIGIAENKLVAKIGSDLQKPDGLVVVGNFESGIMNYEGGPLVLSKAQLYERLKLTDIPGIAKRQEKNLNKLGIRTLVDLKNFPAAVLIKKFGINGYHLHKMGQLEGSWKPKVHLDETIKSIGHMYTLPKEFREKKFFVPVLYKLCEMVAKRLRKKQLMGNILHFYLSPGTNFYKINKFTSSSDKQTSFSDGVGAREIGAWVSDKNHNGIGESKKLGIYLYDGREIFLQAMIIFDRLLGGTEKDFPHEGFKLIGITMAGLRPQIGQLSLFGYDERLKRLVGALDRINAKYGDFTVCRTPVLNAKLAFSDSIGFGRIKEL